MSGVADMITGRSARRQASLAEAAQADQQRRVADEQRRLAEQARGQAQNAQVGGGGLLAYVDPGLKGTLG